MIRYVRQTDDFRCGPMAVLNLQKWLGHKVSYDKDIKKLTKMCKCEVREGTHDEDIIATLRHIGKNEIIVKDCKVIRTLSTIQNHIDRDGAIILTHRAWSDPSEDHLHFSLLVPDDEYLGYVTWVNSFAYDHPSTGWMITPTAISITFHKFEKLVMSKQRIGDKIEGIFITKK